MALQVVVEYRKYVAISTCEPLPHFFTLTGRSPPGGSFLLPLHKLSPICDFHSTTLFPVRTFLRVSPAIEQPASGTKVKHFIYQNNCRFTVEKLFLFSTILFLSITGYWFSFMLLAIKSK